MAGQVAMCLSNTLGFIPTLLLASVCSAVATAVMTSPLCVNNNSPCPDYSSCEETTCKCFLGFSYNSTTGRCQVTTPCETDHQCGGVCAKVGSADKCFCPGALHLDEDDRNCNTRTDYVFRFELDTRYTSSKFNNSHLSEAVRHKFNTILHTQNVSHHETMETHMHALPNSFRSMVLVTVGLVNVTTTGSRSPRKILESAIGALVHDEEGMRVVVEGTSVSIDSVNVYKHHHDADNDDNPEGLNMCLFAHPCNQTTETCVDLRGTAFHCVCYFRGVLKTPYNESNFDELFQAVANLTARFLADAHVHHSPIELLTFQPENGKQETTFIVYTDIRLVMGAFSLSFIQHFYVTAVSVPLRAGSVPVEGVQIFNEPDEAVSNTNHLPIRICGTKYSHCPHGIRCEEHFDGTYSCHSVDAFHYYFPHYGHWRALVDVPFDLNETDTVSTVVAQTVQEFLRKDMYLGPITVTAVESGQEEDMTYVVLKIGFAFMSYNHQKYYIHEGFVLNQPTFTFTLSDGNYSSSSMHRFEYVKFYPSLKDALNGDTGQIIDLGCRQNLCPANTECIATDFKYRCEPYCQRGFYTDCTTCAHCGDGMTTFFNGTHFGDLCVSQCPEDEEFCVYSKDCQPCPEGFYSPRGDPRCYFCHSDMENGTNCDKETVLQGLDDVVDISMKLTLTYAHCPHLGASDDMEVKEVNISHFILELITSHASDPVYNGVCLMTYEGRTAAHCENGVVELESDVCQPDPSCHGDEPCHLFSTNLTVTIYNTLSKYAVMDSHAFSTEARYRYVQSAESAIAESLFDHSQLYRSFEGDQMQLGVIFREHPTITSVTRQEAQKRHIYIVVFFKSGLGVHLVHDSLQEELSILLGQKIQDYLYFQEESSWHFGNHVENLMHFALVFKDGADEEKVKATAEVLLSMHDSLGGTTRGRSILTGPMSIHLSNEAADNTVDWCAVRDRLGKSLHCPAPTECHNYHIMDKSHDLVECSAPGISKVFTWVAVEKSYNQADDETLGEHLVELFSELLTSHGMAATEVIYLDARPYADAEESLVILEVDYSRTLSDSDLTSLSVFAYEYFIATHHTVHLTPTTAFNVSFFEVFLSKGDAWHGHNALVHPLCNETVTGFRVCPNDSVCIDTAQGPNCIGQCEPGSFHDGSGCVQCPVNTTTVLWGAETVDDCFEKCGEGRGFDYKASSCQICPPGLGSEEDQQFCFHESSSDVFPVDLKADVNVSLTDCDFLHELNPYDFTLAANRFIHEIFTNRKHGYILGGLCEPDESCENIKVHVKNQDGRPTCTPSPTCKKNEDCHKYHMALTIDIFGADNQILVHDTDSLRRDASDVVRENLAFVLQRTRDPKLVLDHGVGFDYETMKIQVNAAPTTTSDTTSTSTSTDKTTLAASTSTATATTSST